MPTKVKGHFKLGGWLVGSLRTDIFTPSWDTSIYVYIYCSVKNPVLKFLWQSVKYQQEIPLSKKSVKCLAPRLAREPGAKIPQQNVVKALALSLANSTVKACQDMSSLVKLTGSGLPWRSTDLNLRWPHWHVDEKGANIGTQTSEGKSRRAMEI